MKLGQAHQFFVSFFTISLLIYYKKWQLGLAWLFFLLIKALGQVPRLLVCFFSVLIPFKAKNDFDLFYTVKSLGVVHFSYSSIFQFFFLQRRVWWQYGQTFMWISFFLYLVYEHYSLCWFGMLLVQNKVEKSIIFNSL